MEVREPNAKYLSSGTRVLTSAGELPEDWIVEPIGDLMRLLNGRAFRPDEWSDTGAPIIRIQNLNNPDSDFNFYSGTADERNIVRHGDLLFAWSGTTGSSFGARVWSGATGVLNQHIFKVIPDPGKLSPTYAYRLLLKAQFAIERQAHGFKASFVHVKKSDLISVSVGYPPTLKEQEKIAEALTDADALIDSLEQMLTKKRQIKQGAMQELLTGKRRLPGFTEAWSCNKLRDLVQTPVTDGPHMTPEFVEAGVPFLSVNNLVGNRIDLTDIRFITREDDQLFAKKCKPQRGDVLLGKAASVGKVAIVDDDLDFNIWSPIALIRPGHELESRFLYYQLQSRSVLTQIAVLTNASSQGNLGMGDIEKLQIAYPCIDEQREIASVLSDIDTEITALDSRIIKARALKQAMAQALLTGRIRLVEPTA